MSLSEIVSYMECTLLSKCEWGWRTADLISSPVVLAQMFPSPRDREVKFQSGPPHTSGFRFVQLLMYQYKLPQVKTKLQVKSWLYFLCGTAKLLTSQYANNDTAQRGIWCQDRKSFITEKKKLFFQNIEICTTSAQSIYMNCTNLQQFITTYPRKRNWTQ